MYREASRSLIGEAQSAVGQIERTLRNMYRDGIQRQCIQENLDPRDWWNHPWRIDDTIRNDIRDFKIWQESQTQVQKDDIEYASLGQLHRLFDRAMNLFKGFLTDPTRIRDFLSYIKELNDPSRRGRLAHTSGTALSLDDAKLIIQKSMDIIPLIPSKYHDTSGLGGHKELIESISTAWKKFCQEEKTYQYFNFRSQLQTFVGRDSDIDRIQPSILQHRLVTLHGMGGVGKTHLAIYVTKEHATREITTTFSDGIAFVSLAEVPKDGSAFRQAITRALGKADEEIADEHALIRL